MFLYSNYLNSKENRTSKLVHSNLGFSTVPKAALQFISTEPTFWSQRFDLAHRPVFDPEALLESERPSFDTESSFDPEVSGPKGRTKCGVEDRPEGSEVGSFVGQAWRSLLDKHD